VEIVDLTFLLSTDFPDSTFYIDFTNCKSILATNNSEVEMKKIPYGIQSFKTIIQEYYIFVSIDFIAISIKINAV